MKTPNVETAKYKIDDEIEDLDIIMIMNLTIFNKPSNSTSNPSSHLLTPINTLELDNNTPSSSSTASTIIESFLITPIISMNFNA
jgi:hypothetical protein